MNLVKEIKQQLPTTTCRGLARKLGVSATTIRRHAKKLEIIPAKYVATDSHKKKLSQSTTLIWKAKEDPETRKQRTKENRRKKNNRIKNRRYREDPENRDKVKKRTIKRKKEIQQWFFRLKSELSCKICGEHFPGCLEFHHRDASQKEFSIAKAVREGWSRQRILDEIKKCEVLCANCHRKWHWLNDDKLSHFREWLENSDANYYENVRKQIWFPPL